MRIRALCFRTILLGFLLALIVSCGQPKPPTSTSIPPTPTQPPIQTPTPTVEPTPTEVNVTRFLRAPARPHSFPRVSPVFLDEEGRVIGDFGFGGVALPVAGFVVTPPLPTLEPEDLPPPLLEKNIRPGSMLVLGERPDGAPDYEILKKSVAKSKKLNLEIFERYPNPKFPFVASFPFEMQEISELRPGDPLIFYGYTKGVDEKYYPTEKPATVSAITFDHSVVKMNGSVTGGDFGAPVFAYQCGIEKFVGIVIGSLAKEGRETEAVVLTNKEVLQFLEEQTGIRVQVKESKNSCVKEDPVLKQRAIAAISDGRYDFSYDLCDLKETCDLKKEKQWVRPLQDVWFSKKNPSGEPGIGLGNAFIVGPYAVVIPSAGSSIHWLARGNESPDYDVRYRFVWDEGYEYLQLLGLDKSGKVAVFERPDASKFPTPPMPISLIGNSRELGVGNALLAIGVTTLTDVKLTTNTYQTTDPASLIGLFEEKNEFFFIQSQMREMNNGAGICALRDGECELVGFLYAPLGSAQAETLNKALSIEFVLKAMEEVISGTSPKAQVQGEKFQTLEEERDKARIIELLKDQKPDSASLLFDLVRPDLSGLPKFRTPISLGSVPGEAIILGDSYLLTSAELFPKPFKNADSGTIRDASMGILKVVLIDQENGYALLKKAIPGTLGKGLIGSLPVVSRNVMEPNQEILLAYSQGLAGGSDRTIELVSPGTITFVSADFSMFIVNAFVSPEILGAPIYAKCDGQICAVGILTRPYPVYFEQIKTEGFGLSLDFIFDNIKQKTGIDLRAIKSKE